MTEKIINPGQILTGTLFNEPMRVETVRANGPDTWIVGLVGTQSERFRSVEIAQMLFGCMSTGGKSQKEYRSASFPLLYPFPYFLLCLSRSPSRSDQDLALEKR